jgi:mannose/fructose/N-acetylgalactosamine-specific phosphotransferase system component IIC
MVTRPDARDLFALVGWLLIVVGVSLFDVRVGIIVGGGLLFWLGVTAARAAAREVTSEHPG